MLHRLPTRDAGMPQVWLDGVLQREAQNGYLFHVQEWGEYIHNENAICLQTSIPGNNACFCVNLHYE